MKPESVCYFETKLPGKPLYLLHRACIILRLFHLVYSWSILNFFFVLGKYFTEATITIYEISKYQKYF